MYNNPYVNPYNINQQSLSDRIDSQIAQLNQMKEQIKNNQQPAINQTFQLAPTNTHGMKFANTIEDVNKEVVYFDTPYFSKDMSVLWVKNSKGEIKSYALEEIIQKDAKDIQIEVLTAQVNELKGQIENAKSNDKHVNDTIENEEPKDVSVYRGSTKKSKQSRRDI